jgi:hypothetical protein
MGVVLYKEFAVSCSYVYFIQNDVTKNIKIGHSENPNARLRALQIGSDCSLSLLGVVSGNYRKEAELHGRFEDRCVRGEWFSGIYSNVAKILAESGVPVREPTKKQKLSKPAPKIVIAQSAIDDALKKHGLFAATFAQLGHKGFQRKLSRQATATSPSRATQEAAMSIFVGYPKIGQFRNVIQSIVLREQFAGLDENGDPTYDRTRELPKLSFKGTVKLHGTNAGIGYHQGELWFQSRSNVITATSDNAGFVAGNSHKDKVAFFKGVFESLIEKHSVADDKIVVMFGEWCGGSVQKGVALNQLDKRFVIFDIRVVGAERNDNGDYTYDEWLPIDGIRSLDLGIHNISDYTTWDLLVDFSDPAGATPKLGDLVAAVEAECPYSKAFGASGVGEGIVWKLLHKGKRHVFKAKGAKHSATRVKTVSPVDVEKLNSVNEFVDYAVTENRLNQAVEQVFTAKGVVPTIKGTGQFLKWLVNDVVTEELDTLSENGLCAKDVNSTISKTGREWFFRYLDKLVFSNE